MTYTYEQFRAFKIRRIRDSLAKARAANTEGRRDLALWYLHLAALGRRSIAA